MAYDEAGMTKADRKLRLLGIPVGLEDLGNDPSLGKQTYVAALLSMLEESWSTYVKAELIRGICSCSPDRVQRRRVADHALDILDQHPNPDDNELMFLWSDILNLVDDSLVERVGRMALDPKFGENGAYFTEALRGVKDPRAVDYMVKASRRQDIRNLTLQSLSKKDPARTLLLTAEYLKKDPKNRDLQRLHEKLRKKLEGFGSSRNSVHRTRAAVPHGMKSSSWNIDGENIPEVLRVLSQELPDVLKKEHVLEAEAAVDSLELNKRARFHFTGAGAKSGSELWIDILCDDEDAYIFEISCEPTILSKLEPKVSRALARR